MPRRLVRAIALIAFVGGPLASQPAAAGRPDTSLPRVDRALRETMDRGDAGSFRILVKPRAGEFESVRQTLSDAASRFCPSSVRSGR